MKKEQLLTDLTDEQCEKVVGGVGRNGVGPDEGAGAGTEGWFGGIGGSHGLAGSGPFSPPARGILTVGNGTVTVPFVSGPADPLP